MPQHDLQKTTKIFTILKQWDLIIPVTFRASVFSHWHSLAVILSWQLNNVKKKNPITKEQNVKVHTRCKMKRRVSDRLYFIVINYSWLLTEQVQHRELWVKKEKFYRTVLMDSNQPNAKLPVNINVKPCFNGNRSFSAINI